MAYMKTCPACRKQISSRAEKCPHCGDVSPQQKASVNSQSNSSRRSMNITINAGEVNNGIVADREPWFSKVEDPSLKGDFYCSTCRFHHSKWHSFILRTIILTAIATIAYFVPNYFRWWKLFSFIFKCICVYAWFHFLFIFVFSLTDYCKNKHVIVAVGGSNAASRINSNFKCKFWENKKEPGQSA